MYIQNYMNFYVDNSGSFNYLMTASVMPPGVYDHAMSGSWTNNGGATEITLRVFSNYAQLANWRFTFTVTNASATGPCTPLNPKETLGSNCAEPNATTVQGGYGDPVNAATGNFNERFEDFSIPGRGPGLALDHSYNSLQAGVDGPLGFGWTHAYAMSAAEDPVTHVVTVNQEGGAQISFYPVSGGYEAPPRVAATLVKNADSSFTLKRCNQTTFAFSTTGQLTSITDRNGYSTTLAYAAGKLDTVSDSVTPAPRKLHFNLTGSHLTSVTDDTGRAVTFGYNDGAGNLTDYTDAGGAAWKFTYNAHKLTTVRRPRQAGVPTPPVTTNVYDAQNRVTSQTDELGRQTLFDYSGLDSSGTGSVKIIDPKSNIVVENYQKYVRSSLTRGFGTPAAATWTFETDGSLGVTKVTDPQGRTTVATYDLDGNLRSLRNPLNQVASATYNAFDEPEKVTDAQNVATTYTYDANGNLATVARPLLTDDGYHQLIATRTTTYTYDSARPGDLTSIADPKGKIWAREHDPATGYVTSETDPLGDRTLFAYDTGRGWLTSMVSPRGAPGRLAGACAPPALGCTSFTRDFWGRVTLTTDPNGHQSTDHYDADGNLDSRVDADGDWTTFLYDAADQLTTVQRADSTTLVTHYWADGSVKDTVDGAGKPTAYAYDAQGRLTSSTDPDLRTTTYGYDPAGNFVSKADPGGTCPAWTTSWPPTLSTTSKCTAMAYDAADRLVSVKYSDGVTPNVTSIGYDPVGRRTSMTDGSGSSLWAWDSLGRLTSAKNGANTTVGYGYENLRDPATTITYPGRGSLTRLFDPAGRLQTAQDWFGNVTSFAPDADSNLTGVASPGSTGLGDAYAPFDNADQLMGIAAKANGATVASLAYGRDNAGQVNAVTTTGLADTHTYGYTALNQLKKIDNVAVYSYDAADNVTAMPGLALSGYDPANQLGTATRGTGAATFGYADGRGNRTSASAAAGLMTNYAYDQANRLTSVDTTTYSSQIDAGYYHSVAARSDGTVMAWGANASGQLGDGTTTQRTPPITVPGLAGVTAAAAGAYESAVLKADGTVWMWGWNVAGQLGDGTNTDRTTPVQVVGLSNVTAISTATSHTLALKADGTVWAWGYNSNGQLGNNSTVDSWAPVQVQGVTGVVAIAAGYVHSSALRSDGTVWTWGYNGAGQLGNNSLVDSHLPVQVQGLSGVAGIASGYHHMLAVKSDGTAWAWGYNVAGALGNNSTVDSKLPVQVQGGLAGVAQVAAAGYTSWALRADGSVAAWGNNANGQLGDGTTTNRLLPVNLAGLTGTKGLNPGPAHGLALASNGTAKAWGYNGQGALGNGTLVDSYAPTAVSTYARGTTPKASYTYDGDGLRTKKTVAGGVTNFTWEASSGLPLLIDDGSYRL